MTDGVDFLVGRKDLRQCRFAEAARPALKDGEVLLRIDRFAFSANNITYAVFGEAMNYWGFFPAPAGWGRVPVWGFAEVAESKHPAIKADERLYGYLPMSTWLVVQPDRVKAASFMDATAHRRPLPAPYQLYSRVAADANYDARFEDQQAILWPLFYTSFLIEDFLADNQLFGARSVVLASASSKTALGVAFCLSRNRPQQCEVVGLTSPGNKAFCERLGYYDKVVAYGALEQLPAATPTVFVDMAGEGKLLHRVHHHFREQLKHSCIVGATHWEQRETQHQLPGAKPQFFFAPVQVAKRMKDWGDGGLEKRFGATWREFLPSVNGWMKIDRGRGREAVESGYRAVLEGRLSPEQACVLALG